MLCGALLLATCGGVVVHILVARDSLQTVQEQRNADSARLLAQDLSQQSGDAERLIQLAGAQFDAGRYRRVRLTREDGSVIFEREAAEAAGAAPEWFARAVSMPAPAGEATVSDGPRRVGTLQLWGQVAWAVGTLWAGSLRLAAWLAALAFLAAGGASLALRAWRRPLDAVLVQAQALEERRFVTAKEPRAPELRQLTRTMNSLVRRVHALFEQQAATLDELRQQAHCDTVTALPQRRYFMTLLDAALSAEGQRGAGLVLVRLRQLQAMNRRLGHEATDRLLAALAQVLQSYPRHVQGALTGRLNGSDVALYLPASGIAEETATSLREALRAALSRVDPQADLSIGASELPQPCDAPMALALADGALTRAEQNGPFAVVTVGGGGTLDEDSWRARLVAALQGLGLQLAEYEMRDAHGRLLHLDCPLHVQLEPGGAHEPAAHWLVMAVRCGMVSVFDLAAMKLALDAIEQDQRPRCVNMSAASLGDDAFVTAVSERLRTAPAQAARLWIDVAEAAASHPARLQQVAADWRGLGVRVGLEHAGARLRDLPRLHALGIDYVKIDGAFVQGAALQPAVRELARGLVQLLHGMQLQVLAEGVSDAGDLAMLWSLGFDGATGPALRRGGG